MQSKIPMLGLMVVAAVAVFAAPALADQSSTWENQDHAGSGGAPPTWAQNIIDDITGNSAAGAAASLASGMTQDFEGGTAFSWVYYLNGSDNTNGLAFIYRFAAGDFPGTEDSIDTISYDETTAGGTWYGTGTITEWGAGGGADGWSTEVNSVDTPGQAGWTDGDPYKITWSKVGTAGQYPFIRFNDGDDGTRIAEPSDSSSYIYFKCPDAKGWKVENVDLIGSGGEAAVIVAPVPGAVLLGVLGLGSAGFAGWMKKRRQEKA